jgi:hypothetical protein
MIEWRRRGFLPDFFVEVPFMIRILLIKPTAGNRKLSWKWYGPFDSKWIVDTLTQGQKLFYADSL